MRPAAWWSEPDRLNGVAFAGLTKAEFAYQAVRDRILTGQLKPGSLLDQETLAAQFDVSTTPLREAVRRLAAENLLSVQAHKRVIVTPLTRAELLDLYQVRIELEPFGAALSATVATAADHAHTQDCLPAMSPDPIERLRLNRLFHRSLYGAARNQVLTDTLDALADRADRYRMSLIDSEEAMAKAIAEHEEIAAAFGRGDAEQVRSLFRNHLAQSLRNIEKRLFD